MATRIKPPAPLEQPLTFTRADPAELARFDPSTKICMMNCGPHRDDPRTSAERKLLCPECWPNVRVEAPQPAPRKDEDA